MKNKYINNFISRFTLSIPLLFFTGFISAGSPDKIGEGEKIVWEGITAFYNEEYTQSLNILRVARSRYPEHPAVHFVWGISEWLYVKEFIGYDSSYQVLETALNEVIPIYKRLADEYPDKPQYKLFLGTSHGMKARIYLGKKKWSDVLYSGFKGYWQILKLYRSYPELWDAYLPMGVLNYYVGSSSQFIRLGARLLGMEADREVGLRQIRIAAEKAPFAWIEAHAILAFIYLWVDGDYELALPVTKRLKTEFPNSMYHQHLYTEALIRLGRLEEAEKNLQREFQMVATRHELSRKGWMPTLFYQKALLKFHQNELDSALVLANRSIREFHTEMDTPLGFAYLLRGKIYDLKGDRKSAMADYRSAMALDNYTSAVSDAQKYLTDPYRH